MDKIKTLNFYIGGDAGCVDVAEAKLTGYTLVSDKDLKRLEDEKAQKDADHKKMVEGAMVISDACDKLVSYNRKLFNALSELAAQTDDVLKFENIGNYAALKEAFEAADAVLTGNSKYREFTGVVREIAENNNQQTKHKGFDKIVWTAGLHAIYKNTTYFIHSVDLDEGLIGLRNMHSNDDPFWVRFENAEIIQ